MPPVTPAPSPPASPTWPSETDRPSESPPTVKPVRFKPGELLQVCELFEQLEPGDDLPEDWISALRCQDAIGVALQWLDLTDLPERAYVSYSCFDNACADHDPDLAYVTIDTGAGVREIAIAQSDARFTVVADRERLAPSHDPFVPPPPRRIDVGDAPASIAKRRRLPTCGEETADRNQAGRRCFVMGVLAGSPVEFVSRQPATEGGLVTTIYRFEGTGGIVVLFRGDDGWVRYATGIRPMPTDEIFTTGGRASNPTPVR
jgi:hypothetical protein